MVEGREEDAEKASVDLRQVIALPLGSVGTAVGTVDTRHIRPGVAIYRVQLHSGPSGCSAERQECIPTALRFARRTAARGPGSKSHDMAGLFAIAAPPR